MKRLFKSTRDVTASQRVKDKKRAALALGKPLNGHPVHHHSRIQLVICENTAYHWLLHARESVLRSGGNPNLDDLCRRCKRPRRIAQLVAYLCKSCARIEQREHVKRAAEREAWMIRARAANLLSIGRLIRRLFRTGGYYEFDLSLAYSSQLASADVIKAKEVHARYLRLKRTA